MPDAQKLIHRFIDSGALPYASYGSPTRTDPSWQDGLNLLTSIEEISERRPGFIAFETMPTTFTGDIRRQFVWRRWNSNRFLMLNEVTLTQSKVYKLLIGTDASFILIHTSSVGEPFDFIVANNHVFFGNGTDMKKYDGTTVSNWGIVAPAFAPTVEFRNISLTFASAAGTNWTTPTNALASDDAYATYTTTTQDDLKITNASATLPTGAVVTGVEVILEGNATDASSTNRQIRVGLTKDGTALVGTRKTAITLNKDVDTVQTLGTSTDLWGTTFTEAEVEASTFGVLVSDNDLTGAGTIKIDRAYAKVYFRTGAGIIAVLGGYRYVYCYENGATGHLSSPSPQSDPATSDFSVAQELQIGTTLSSDTQVTGVRIFRTTDGGGGIFFEIQSAAFAHSIGPHIDGTMDVDLQSSQAPIAGMNDPPPPSKGFVYYANRIGMFADNKFYFTGWEEISNGVQEECVPTGDDGNFWAFKAEVSGLSVARDGFLIFCPGSIYKLTGDSVDNFFREDLAELIGVREHATIARLGNGTAWLDSSNSVWLTDNGLSFQELGKDIRPDLENIDHSQASMTFYVNKTFRWLCLLDGGAGRLRVFDLDRNVWMPPWTVGGRAICTGETASGSWDLLIGHNTKKCLKLSTTTLSDDGTAYSAFGLMALTNLVPEQQPGRLYSMEYVETETNPVRPSTVQILVDDDATLVAMTDITANRVDAPLRTQGTQILDDWYYGRKPAGRRVAVRFDWAAATTLFRLYTIDIASYAAGGR